MWTGDVEKSVLIGDRECVSADWPCVGEGGGVAVTKCWCLSNMDSSILFIILSTVGTCCSRSLCSSSFLATLRSSRGQASSSDVVWIRIRPRDAVLGCCTNCEKDDLSITCMYQATPWSAILQGQLCQYNNSDPFCRIPQIEEHPVATPQRNYLVVTLQFNIYCFEHSVHLLTCRMLVKKSG